MAFRGAFDYSLDAKNRLTVPAKFRHALSEGVVLVKDVEPCVAIWRTPDFERHLEGALGRLNPMSRERRQLERFFHGNAFDAELDSAGRLAIPGKLMEHAGLKKEVVVTGAGSLIEVWDRERWQSVDEQLTADVPDLTAALGALE